MKVMRGMLGIGVVLMFLASCNFGKPETKVEPDIFTDTVLYEMKTIRERAKDCSTGPDSTCTMAEISYPVFKGQDALNDTLKNRLLNLGANGDEKPDSSFQTMISTFFKSYEEYKKDDERKNIAFDLQEYAQVVNQDSCLIAIRYGTYSFSGGAHGSGFDAFINWNPKTKKVVYLNDILLPNSEKELNIIGERIFRKDEKLADNASLEQDYFFKDNKFALNENYLFTPTGIRFLYNEYEIKPYVAGQTELNIPWAQLRTLIKPHSVVAQYIEKNAGI
ncbi:DUF3298 and DUF4163 domain-containing protein [Mucilaginibacter psychrotolerans]|nr:DUF3298 and DUF4163 domain-containing protein [Mucilaginibacter psychrotolerans]